MIKLNIVNVLRCTSYLLICSLCLSSCADRKLVSSVNTIAKDFDWQGHRGCRGLMPENSVPGFLEALRYPVTTLEMDLVMSKDGKIIVSHEPWMNATICAHAETGDFPESESQKHNIYTLTLEEIRQYDCGSKGNPQFPRQQKIAVTKPTLAGVVSAVKKYCQESRRPMPAFNIEIKSSEAGYDIFVPQPAEFVRKVLAEVAALEIGKRTTLQSFDLNVLRELRLQGSDRVRISYLVERNRSIEDAISQLGFIPQIYSPHYRLVTAEAVKYAHEHNMKVIPWTVNSTEDFRKMIQLGVDGIITDYPDLIATLNQK